MRYHTSRQMLGGTVVEDQSRRTLKISLWSSRITRSERTQAKSLECKSRAFHKPPARHSERSRHQDSKNSVRNPTQVIGTPKCE